MGIIYLELYAVFLFVGLDLALHFNSSLMDIIHWKIYAISKVWYVSMYSENFDLLCMYLCNVGLCAWPLEWGMIRVIYSENFDLLWLTIRISFYKVNFFFTEIHLRPLLQPSRLCVLMCVFNLDIYVNITCCWKVCCNIQCNWCLIYNLRKKRNNLFCVIFVVRRL